ncbi:hypothetical protein ACFSQQ_22065 [Mesorhizobium kowhaii]|uniref:ATP-dependent DNA ligase n=1 Tax=Mesorhizobium kowhaii TaxID=1300272 RepID=UPI0035EFE8BF
MGFSFREPFKRKLIESSCCGWVHEFVVYRAVDADPCGEPPEGDGWIHEVKFDGYRSQIVRDAESVRIFTRRGLDWTAKFRDITEAAKGLNAQCAIIDGEVIVTNEAGLSDF